MVKALRFNAVMSSWRGIRFGFNGSKMGALEAFVLAPAGAVLTLGLALPWAWSMQNAYLIQGHSLGSTPASTTANSREFWRILGLLALSVLAGLVVVGVLLVVVAGVGGLFTGDVQLGLAAPWQSFMGAVFGAAYVTGLTFLYAVVNARYMHVVYGNIVLAGNKMRSSISIRGYFWVTLVNSFLLLFTLGLFYPWARVRVTQYLQDNLWVDAQDLDNFAAQERKHQNALGDEIGEAFDLGIGV